MNKKIKPGHFIELPNDFEVEVLGAKKSFTMKPSGIYITWSLGKAWIHYAGNQAGESHAEIIIPSDPEYLRKLSKEFKKLAKKIEAEHGD